jgi:drug/metabolite transporter (DMT)-like permease
MIFLFLSILFSSIILVIFKGFERYKIDLFQAIVWNYVTAVSCGFLLYGNQWQNSALTTGNWKLFALICGISFIGIFTVMGKSSQQNGIGSTAIAGKMSLAISIIALIIFYNEALTIWKTIGILAAILSVVLLNFSKNKQEATAKKGILLLFIIFLGSGLLDVLLNFAIQPSNLGILTPNLFSAIGFGIAGCIGLTILGIQLLRKKAVFQFKSILGGIVLGIPNYFSIYLLLKAYPIIAAEKHWTQSSILGINNVVVVLVSSLLALLFFKEKMNKIKALGFITAIIATYLLVG